jgi:NAD(P)-dependent dehydrogenase (short-subunit alcohol dehydrogenase family)
MPDLQPTAPAVLITGASSGIGEAAAMRLSEMGRRVFAGVRRQDDARRLEDQASGRLTAVLLDVTDACAIRTAAETVAAATGEAGLAGLVNNAGIGIGGPLELVPVEEWRLQFEVNVLGVVAVTQAFMPQLRAARGRIVNVSSVSGLLAAPYFGPYAASKFALEALSDALRGEVRRFGMHVSLIEPGAVQTPIWDKSRARIERRAEQTPAEKIAPYEGDLEAVRKAVGKAEGRAMPASVVAEAIVHALSARRPRPRYVLPRSERFSCALSRCLPVRLRDWLLRRAMGMR